MEGIKRKVKTFTYCTNDITKLNGDSTFKDVFSYNLVNFMKKYDITTAELSRKIDVSAPLIQLWRSGFMPNEVNFKELCHLFEVRYARFFKQ